jgi:mannose-6-phosphate isomerase-like protein (cupin superfamily)
MSYTLKNLREVEDSAPKFGFAETQEARFARADLEAQDTGISFHRVKPGQRQAFAHRHDVAEEIYVILSGTGQLKLDDDVIDVRPLDAIRVAPSVKRSFAAGTDGMEVIAFGPHHEGDGELLTEEDFWAAGRRKERDGTSIRSRTSSVGWRLHARRGGPRPPR